MISQTVPLDAQTLAHLTAQQRPGPTPRELAASALQEQLRLVARAAAHNGETRCDIHVPPELAVEVASLASSLGFETTYFYRGLREQPSGRLTLGWPARPHEPGPAGKPPPPSAGLFRGGPEPFRWRDLLAFLR